MQPQSHGSDMDWSRERCWVWMVGWSVRGPRHAHSCFSPHLCRKLADKSQFWASFLVCDAEFKMPSNVYIYIYIYIYIHTSTIYIYTYTYHINISTPPNHCSPFEGFLGAATSPPIVPTCVISTQPNWSERMELNQPRKRWKLFPGAQLGELVWKWDCWWFRNPANQLG